MANVKVAVRVRPPSKKELDAGAVNIVDVNEDVLSITNLKINSSEGDRHRERVKSYSFDHCYHSVDRQSDNYASQELIYQDLGTEVLNASFSGYNACLLAYGQTGSGKTYTVMGDDADAGLIPRICEGMCSRVDDLEQGVTFKIEVSYLEIYNERVRDLLASSNNTNYTLKVREHPKDGPYVQDLTRHLVSDFNSVMMLIAQGNRNRTTAATHMHEASSRSHAIFTLNFVQAKMVNNMPSEIVSKINLVDLAGSERANLNYSKERLHEGANINKSLVTLGNCISALGMDSDDDDAENSMALSAASMESLALSEDGDFNGPKRRPGFIPYRNSVLTWLLKDSLGGNSRTIMIATISPSSTYFNETMSTLRYARRAKRIINQPLINEDPNVRLIRELRAEINRLKSLLNSASLSSSQASLVQDATISKMLAENEQKVDQLTEAWVDKWREAARIMQECNVGIRRESMGVIVESELPHLIGMDDDLLSTGIILYHLMEGQTTIGREDSETEQDIVLWGPGIECQHAVIVNHLGRVALHPVNQSACAVNGNDIHEPIPLSQGAVVLLGKTNMFRFNHPVEAAKLRERRASSIKPEDVEEIRRPRKNSVTLRVHNNLTAITEEGSRIRKISLSRETPPLSLDSPCAVPRGRNLDSSTSPIPEVSSIMMYNPGVELERQHKIKVDKVERTRKRLEELQDKKRHTQEAHQEEEERMKLAYEEHQQMIQEQRELLQRLQEEHEKVKQETEGELEEMRQRLAMEKEQGVKQLEEERTSPGTDQTRKASLVALNETACPHVVIQGTELLSDPSVLNVDRKRLAQMELMQKKSQRKAEAALERRLAAFDRQRSASLRLIEQEERRLHEIECIPSLSDRFASASNDSLDSSLRSEDEMSNGMESRAVIGWDRVSPIGGRSDSDSASGKAASNSSDKEDNGIESTIPKTVTPPPSVGRTGLSESPPHRTAKHISSRNQSSHPRPNKPQAATCTCTSPVKPKSISNSVFSRLYQQQAPRFDFLHRKPHRPHADDQSPRQGNVPGVGPSAGHRSLNDGSVDVNARSNRLGGKTIHSKSPISENQASLTRNQYRDTLKTESKLRTKSFSPRHLPGKVSKTRNTIPKTLTPPPSVGRTGLSESPPHRTTKHISRNQSSPPRPNKPQAATCTSPVKPKPAAKRKDGKASIHVPSAGARSKSPLKAPAPERTVHNSKSSPKPEIQSNTTGKHTSPPRLKRTKTPSSESAIETAMKENSAERHKNASKLSKEPVGSKGKSPAGTKDKAKANLQNTCTFKPISKAIGKLKPKATPHAETFFVTLDKENNAKMGIGDQEPTHLNTRGDIALDCVATSTVVDNNLNVFLQQDYKECVTPIDLKNGHQADYVHVADVIKNPRLNPDAAWTEANTPSQLKETAVTNLVAYDSLHEQLQIPHTDLDFAPAVSNIDSLTDDDAKNDIKEPREPEDAQKPENPNKLSNVLPKESASVTTADMTSPSVIKMGSIPEIFVLTKCHSKIVSDDHIRKQSHTETMGETLQTVRAADELRKAEKSCHVAEPEEVLKHIKNTTSPSVQSSNKGSSESGSAKSPSSSRSPTKLVKPKDQSALSPLSLKSRKKLKKRRTPIKSKSSKKRAEQQKQHFVLDDAYKGITILEASQADTDKHCHQSSSFSCSPSSSSTGTFGGEFSNTDSLHSRSPDEEVALISDGVSDPPDLSDKPATPTDMIVKPLPSPKILAESVFWASLSSASSFDDEILDDGGESLVEPLEILEKELGQSSDLGSDYDDDDDDEDESGGEQMDEFSDLTILADGQLHDTVEFNSTAVMTNPLREESLLLIVDEKYDRKGNSDNHLTVQTSQGANLRPEKNFHSPYNEEANFCSDLTDNPQTIHQSKPSPSSFTNNQARFISKLNIEPVQGAFPNKECEETVKPKFGKIPSCVQVHFGNEEEPCVCLEPSLDIVPVTSLPDAPYDVNQSTHLDNICLETLETNTSSSPDVRFMPRVGYLQIAAANLSTIEDTLEVLGHQQKINTKSPRAGLSGITLKEMVGTDAFSTSSTVELREDMVPDGAIVESKADESQNLLLNRGKLVTEINPSLIQEELIRLRTLLNSISIAPCVFHPPELQSTLSLSKSNLASLKAEVILKGHDAQGEGSVSSTSPDSSAEELSIIEQLRGLSEKLGSSLSEEDTTDIMERARSISVHLEQAHSSVYSPSLVEGLRELSLQLDASKFLTIERYEEKGHRFDCKSQNEDEKSALFESAHDLTLYQTAFEITQENVQPTPISSLSPSPVQLQSTPLSRESNPLIFAELDIKIPVVSPVTYHSSSEKSASADGDDAVFLEYSGTGKSTPDVDEVFDIDSDLSDGEDLSVDEDDAMDTAERVMSEMSSFRLQLDLLSGSDTLDDDDFSSEGSNDELAKAATGLDEGQTTQEVLCKTRPPLGSRSSHECLLPTISEECLSSSDVDESCTSPVNALPTESPTKSPDECYLTTEDHTLRLDDPPDELHADPMPCTSSVTMNEEILSLNEPAIPIRFLRAVAKNLSEGQQEGSILEEVSSQESQSVRSHLWKPENPVEAEPLLGKEFAATKAKLSMLVRILGGNWESLGETSSEGSAASSPVQGEFNIAPKEHMQLTEDEPSVSASDERFESTYGNRHIVTYDESAQTDPITEQDLNSHVGQVHEELATSIETDDSAYSLKPLLGAQVTDKITQTTLRQKVSNLDTEYLSPLHQKTSFIALPTFPPETLPFPSQPQCQPSSDEDTDVIEDQPVSLQLSTNHSTSKEQDQISSNHLLYQPDRLTDAPDAGHVPLKNRVSASAELKTPMCGKKLEDDKWPNDVDQHYKTETDQALKDDLLQPLFSLLPTEPVILKASVVLKSVFRFPPCREDQSFLPASGCVESIVSSLEDGSKRLKQHEVNEKISPFIQVPVELVRKTAVVPKELNFLWPSTPKHAKRKVAQKSLLDPCEKTNMQEFREWSKHPSCSLVEEVTIGETNASKDASFSSFTKESKPGIYDGGPLKEIPEIRLLGPVEKTLVKEAVTLSDEPIVWPFTGTDLNEKHHGQTCEPSDTNSLFQPIRESSSSSQNPSIENLSARNDSTKAPEHGQQLEIQSKHSGKDTNLNELKELSTVMGLSPQRSYSTDEELIQIFSKGVAHFRSLKQDLVKPTLVAVATNTSPVKTLVSELADAAIMTDREIKQAHAYTSMSPDNGQELCLNRTTEIIPENITPFAQLTAAQLLGMIVDKPQDMIHDQQAQDSNIEYTINTEEVTRSPHENEALSKISVDHEPVPDSIEQEQQTGVSTTPAYENPTGCHTAQVHVPENSKEVPVVHYQNSQTEKPLKDKTKIPDKSCSSEDNTCADDAIDDEEQRLLNELRKRMRASQEAAKRAMACALKLRQKNLCGHPMEENANITADLASPKQRSKTEIRPAFDESPHGETKEPESDHKLLTAKELDQSGSKDSVLETVHLVTEIANKECRLNFLPLEEFAQNVYRLMEEENNKDHQVQPAKIISHTGIILRQPNHKDGSTDSGNSSVLEVPNFEITGDGQLGPSKASQQPCHGVQNGDPDKVSMSLDKNPQSQPELVTEIIQKEAICISDFNRLALKLSKLEHFVLSAEQADSTTAPGSDEKNPLRPLGSSRFISQSPDQQNIHMSSLEFQTQETDCKDIDTRPFFRDLLNKPSNDVELLLPSELAHKKSKCSPTFYDIREKLAKLTENSRTENEITEDRMEIGAKKDEKHCVSGQKLIQPVDVINNVACEKPKDFNGRDSLKSHRPLLRFFSDISFDLDNDNDEDLKALRETNENLDRIIAETSSLESDFEDDMEPELAKLIDDETDTFTPQGSSIHGLAASGCSLQEKPQKANSAPAALVPEKADDSNYEMEEEEEELSSLCLRGILISPEKLEWLLADSESGESSSTSSPIEKDDSAKLTSETPAANDNRRNGSGQIHGPDSERESRDDNTRKETRTNKEEIHIPQEDQHHSKYENQNKHAKVFEYEVPATKQGVFLPEMKSIFVLTKEDEQPHPAYSCDPSAFANSRPLHVKDNRLKPETHESQQLDEEIHRLKCGHVRSLENSVELEVYSLVKKHAQEGLDDDDYYDDDDDDDDDSSPTLDTLNTNLTQSSGVFSASTRDTCTELSWLRERRLSSEQLGSTSSETENADLSRIHQEYRNILEDRKGSPLNYPTSTQSTPTNVFTQTDEESPLSSSGNDDEIFEKENVRLGASWPLRDPISTKLDPRRDIAVELMEASLMHGIGETDAFLKFLDSDLPLEKWKSPEVTLRHRRSQSVGASLKLDAEASEHESSPSKQKPRQVKFIPSQSTNLRSEPTTQGSSPSSPDILSDKPTSLSPSQNALPSERRRFLQQLRSNVVSVTSTQRPERAKIDALLRDSWMGKEPSRSDSEQEGNPCHINTSNSNRDDIEVLLEESRHMRERSRAEIAKAEENLIHARRVSRQGQLGRGKIREGFPPATQGSLDRMSSGARPKSAATALSVKERVRPHDGLGDFTNHHQESFDNLMRQRRPHSAHGSFDMYNCQDAIDKEIQCLRAASAAMSSRSPIPARPDIPSWRPQLLTYTHAKPSPPPLQRYLTPYDPGESRYDESTRQGRDTVSSQTRSHPSLAIPIIALHPPSPEEIDPSSIPAIARANEVLQASYKSPGILRSQSGLLDASWQLSEASLSDPENLPSLVKGGARVDASDVPRTQTKFKSSERAFQVEPLVEKISDPLVPTLVSGGTRVDASDAPKTIFKNSGRASLHQNRTFQTTSASPNLLSYSSHPPPPKKRGQLDPPDAPAVKDNAGSPPRRSGRQSRLSSLERLTPELPPIIETPLVSLDSLYELAVDQAMAILIREMTLTGKVDPDKSEQLTESNGWRYQGQEKGILLWQKMNKYCSIDSFLGLGVLEAPAQTVFNLINNSSRYNCLHKAITNVKLLHTLHNAIKVIRIQCDMDNCLLKKQRDFCCVIKHTHRNGRWYIAATSVKHPLCPAVSTAVRGQILCCGVSMEPVYTENGEHCRIAHLSQIDLQGDLKPTLVNRLTSRLPLGLARVRDCVEIGHL